MSELALQLIAENKRTKNPYLDLGNCGLTKLPKELFDCVWLEELVLSNRYWDYKKRQWIESSNNGGDNTLTAIQPEIANLTQLKTLFAGKYPGDRLNILFQISGNGFLEKLTGLESVDLSKGQTFDISFLENLTGLQSLDLSSNQISDISFLAKLTGLQSLALSKNQISDYSFLEKLTGLQSLKLSSNQISDIRFLAQLTGLQSLNLSSNQISDISFLEKLTGLQFVDLSFNQISDIRFLEKLTGLKYLNLSSNRISDIRFLAQLTGLQSLNLSSNQISDISFLEKLTSLQTLNLRGNKISEILFLAQLTGLQYLDLSSNQVSDISFLEHLTGLKFLNLSSNQIADITLRFLENIRLNPVKKKYAYERGIINLFGNELLNIPEEVFNQGRNAIIDHLSGELKPLNECKLIFVGDGAVGKTSLMRRVVFNEFDNNEQTTHGINKISWKLKNHSGDTIKVNLWDFGGQHIQHSLHQFFFTQRVIYVLVLNPRNDEKAAYWLEQVEKLGKGSEIMVVYNWWDAKDIEADFLKNFRQLRQKYPALPDPFLLSCQTGEGIKNFRKELKKKILKNEGLNIKYRKEWFNIKTHLEEKVDVETNYVEYTQYEKWCSEENYNDAARRNDLLKILNSIGSIVYFDKPVLNSLQILNPEWITTGAYSILTAKKTNENKGDLSWPDLKEIFKEDKSVFSNKKILIRYTEKDFHFILELMREYGLLQENPLRKHSYLIPSAFGEKPSNPAYNEIQKYSRNYRIQFNSPFEILIIHRFIAKNLHNITGKDYWHSGIYMKHGASNTFALVETNLYSYRIDCWIKGDNIRGFWETIRNDFREIFGMYHNFPFSEEVLYKKAGIAVYLPYDEMLDALKNGISIIDYHPTYKLKNIHVFEVLDLFETKQQTQSIVERERPGDTYIFNAEVSSSQISGTGNIQTNVKVDLSNNADYNELKDLLLDLEEYEAADIEWKQSLALLLKETHQLQLANDKADQKVAESKIDRALGRFKKVKDWVEVGALPVLVAEKGHQMMELWDNLKHFLDK